MNPASDIASASYVEGAFWLPAAPACEAAGRLLLKGWGFVDFGPPQLALAAGLGANKITPLTDFFEPRYLCRSDVRAVYPGAPMECGFNLAIPLSDRPSNAWNLSLILRGPESAIAQPLTRIDFAEEDSALSARYGLTGLRRTKFENLLLNERERLAGTVRKSSKPISLYIDPSFACNLHCPHCISEMLREQGLKRKNTQPADIDRILERYGDTLIRVTLALWGEPLLNKRFAQIVRLLKQYEIFCETSTNLSVPLSDLAIEEIVASGLDEMRLSIDGATQTTYELYRKSGKLDLVLNNVRRLVETKRRVGLNTPKLRWQYLLFPWNEQECAAAEQLARDCGVDEFYCFPGDRWTEAPTVESRTVEDDQRPVREQGATIHAAMQRRLGAFEHAGCDFLDHTLAVHSDGAVFPCCYFPAPKDSAGYWPELEDPFNSPQMLRLRAFVQDLRAGRVAVGPSPCAGCGTLTRGYVEDHLDFMTAFEHLRSQA